MRCDDTIAAATLEPEPAASAARDSRESPVEPDLNPKRRLLMKSASSTGESQRQWTAKGEEVSHRHRSRNANWRSVGNGHW